MPVVIQNTKTSKSSFFDNQHVPQRRPPGAASRPAFSETKNNI